MRRLFLRFFPDDHKGAADFASKMPEFEISMATLQGHLIENKHSAKVARVL